MEQGHGDERGLRRCEEGGAVTGADRMNERAIECRLGSLGSGNHFLAARQVAQVYDETVAAAFGLAADQACVMIHCDSRGLGHRIRSDCVRAMGRPWRGTGSTCRTGSSLSVSPAVTRAWPLIPHPCVKVPRTGEKRPSARGGPGTARTVRPRQDSNLRPSA
ncbi:RtcB family protein [Streptomyces sp. Wb2n-11]|uniref:RtcB family protein n=1 Tax=Streptomyces sp. Wb2n-11 TaxID=1030533 RepID=UPI00210001C9|nr:RtcB family protein [Streptomyces sp. Wb2n-11]